MAQSAAEGDRGGKREEEKIAAGHECIRQALLVGDDGDIARHRRLRDFAEYAEIEAIIFAEPLRPGGIDGDDVAADDVALIELDPMALAIVEADRLHMLEARQ